MPPDLLSEVRDDVKVIRERVTELATEHKNHETRLDDHETRLRLVETATTRAAVIGGLIAAFVGAAVPATMRLLNAAPPAAQTQPTVGYYLVPLSSVPPSGATALTHP